MPIYLKLGTVKGESKAKGHEGWIELDSLSIGETRTSDQNATSGDVSCTRRVDSTSVTLRQLSVSGKIQPATVDFVDPQGKIFLQLQFQDLLIASHSFSNAASGGPLVETFTLVYGKMTMVRFFANSGTVLQDLLSTPVP
jgi:type VI protein secretion system component Hcp